MINIFLDCETTGINPMCDEVIEMYCACYKGNLKVDEYYFKSQVNNWSYEAEEIHKINYHKMLTYPSKKDAWNSFLKWLPTEFNISIYVNPNTQLGNVLFDKAIVQNEVMLHLDEYHYCNIPFKPANVFNVYEKAKKAFKLGLFAPRKNKNRFSFSQENVYKGLFNDKYNAHNCVDDVNALIRIDNKLDDLMRKNVDNGILSLV
jgi:hypothetical protein